MHNLTSRDEVCAVPGIFIPITPLLRALRFLRIFVINLDHTMRSTKSTKSILVAAMKASVAA